MSIHLSNAMLTSFILTRISCSVRFLLQQNEYAKEMREYRESENPKKALGKVFVMVDSFTPENLPIPNKTTKFYAVLDNGLHMVKTGTSTLRSGQPSKIGQEFELIQHKNLQFSLTLVVVRDSHLIEPNPNLMTPSSPKKDKHSPSLTSGFSRFFTSPKKQAAKLREREMDNVQNQFSMRSEPILNYINREGAFGRSNVVFDQVASNCLARCLVLELPVSGVSDPSLSLNGPSSNSISSVNRNDFNRHLNKVRGTLRLKLFYLPPMPSVPKKLLPENLADCINGMNAAAATENEPRLEGVLTQLGGDCVVSKRNKLGYVFLLRILVSPFLIEFILALLSSRPFTELASSSGQSTRSSLDLFQ